MNSITVMPQCASCKCYYTPEFRRNGVAKKTCNRCLEAAKNYRNKYKCEHGKQRPSCKDCGGASICEHNRLRNQCKECGGASICDHGRQRCYCKECGGSQICEHDRIRNTCKECGGSSICEHGRQRNKCKECGNELHKTIKTMINCSKISDLKYNRFNESEFITYDYVRGLIDQSTNLCCYCNTNIQYINYDSSLATIERIDNDLGHIIGNCKIACRTCNISKTGSKQIKEDSINI